MERMNWPAPGAVSLTSMQLTYSTADVERVRFTGEIGTPDGNPTIHYVTEQAVMGGGLGVQPDEVTPGLEQKLTVIHGQLHEVLPTTPPGAIEMPEDPAILRLADF